MPRQPAKSSDPQPSGRKSKSGFAEARRRRLSTLSLVLTLAFCVSCSGFNDPIEAPLPDEIDLESASHDLPEDDQPEFDPTEQETDFEMEESLAWNDLTRLAREHRLRGELVEARERLSQAAIQVADLDPTDVQRRTVFGLRARLAGEFAARGDVETADEMADQLFEEAEESPELADVATRTEPVPHAVSETNMTL